MKQKSWVVVAMLVLASSGCAAAARDAAKSAAPAAAEATLKEVREPDNRNDLAILLGDPKIREATGALAESVASGALEGLTKEEQLQRMQRFSEALVEQVSRSLARTMSSELGPQISRIAADSVQQALDRLQSPQTAQRASELARSLTVAIVEGLTEELAASGTQPIAYAPSGEATSAIALLAREAGRGAALGFQDAVRETETRRLVGKERPGDVLAMPARLADLGLGTLSLIGLALGALALGLIAALAFTLLRARRLKRESQAREDAVLFLASVIKSAENAPWAPDLRERIREASRESSASDTLRNVLRKHSGLRLERSDPPRAAGPLSERMHPAR